MAGATTRRRIIRADLANWDGRNATVTSPDASGGTISGLPVGNEVDILSVYSSDNSRTAGTINAALSRLGSTVCTIVFAPGTWTIDVDVTIPSNIVSHVPAGVIFDIASGKTLTFNGPIQVDYLTQWTSGAGTVSVAGGILGGHPRTSAEIAAGVTPTDYSYEPGHIARYVTNSTPGTTDCTTGIQNAISVVKVNGGFVDFDAETYLVTGLTLYSNVILRGKGANSTVIKRTATGGAVVTIDNTATVSRTGLRDLRILHTGTGSTDHGLAWTQNTTNLQYSEFVNLLITAGDHTAGTGGDGLNFNGTNPYGCLWCTFIDVHVSGCGGRGFYFDGIANQLQFINCRAIDCYSHGFYSDNDGGSTGGQSIVLQSFNAERIGLYNSGANAHGVAFIGTDAATMIGCYIEDIGYATDSLSSAGIRVSNVTTLAVMSCTFNKCNYDLYIDGTLANSSVHLIGNQFFATANKNQLATLRLDGTTTTVTCADNYIDHTNHALYVVNYYSFNSSATEAQILGHALDQDGFRLGTVKYTGFVDLDEQPVEAPTTPFEVSFASVTSSFVALGALNDNTTITAFPAAVEGREFTLRLRQAVAGSKTITFPAGVSLVGDAFTLTATADKVDVIKFIYSAATTKWLEVSRSQNLSA